jgi:hypothetical protein
MADSVNHPSHYTAYNGFEVIDLVEQMNFNRGNAVEYIARAGLKNGSSEVEDLRKAAWYINREIYRLVADEKLLAELRYALEHHVSKEVEEPTHVCDAACEFQPERFFDAKNHAEKPVDGSE